MDQYVPLSAREKLTFTITQAAHATGSVVCFLKRPTPTDKASLAASMFEAGLRQPSLQQTRAAQINAIVRSLPEGEGDQAAALVENFYDLSDAHATAYLEWLERDRQRLLDEANGADKVEPEAEPESPISRQMRREIDVLLYDASADPTVKRLLGERQRFNAQNAFWLVRAHLCPETQDTLPPGMTLEYGSDRLLTEKSLDDLIDFLGNRAFDALADFIDRQYGLASSEGKNSESPPAIWPPKERPSPAVSDELAMSHGDLTTSNTDPTPERASAPTIEASSNTFSEHGGSMESIFPTEDPASTSP